MLRNSILFLSALFLPLLAFANGGIKEIAEGKYVVNVSMSPISPYVGDRQQMLIAVSDIPGNLIAKDIRMDVSLTLQNTETGKEETVVRQTDVLAHSGVLPLEYTYAKAGIYILVVKFRLPDEPKHTYEPDDFHIEAKEKCPAGSASSEQKTACQTATAHVETDSTPLIIAVILGMAAGAMFTSFAWFISKRS